MKKEKPEVVVIEADPRFNGLIKLLLLFKDKISNIKINQKSNEIIILDRKKNYLHIPYAESVKSMIYRLNNNEDKNL